MDKKSLFKQNINEIYNDYENKFKDLIKKIVKDKTIKFNIDLNKSIKYFYNILDSEAFKNGLLDTEYEVHIAKYPIENNRTDLIGKYLFTYIGTDIRSYKIIEVNEKTIKVQSLIYVRDFEPKYIENCTYCINNQNQKWVIKDDTDGTIFRIKNKKIIEKDAIGNPKGYFKYKGNKYYINDYPLYYYDFNFS